MRLTSKHENQQIVGRADFSGGVNTSVAVEMIAENELADCMNMDVDKSTKLLKTVSGAKTVYKPGYTIAHAIYDKINTCWLLVDTNRNVYRSDLSTSTAILGTLNGKLAPKYTEWEDGVLIAAGGSLQYYNGKVLTSITKSESSTYTPPNDAEGVYVRSGRVLIDHQNEIVYSGVGDETKWNQDDNNASTSKFLETGYKDGGKIIAMTSLSNAVIVVKDNNRVYKISGEFPNWSVSEISRNADCRSRMSCCAVVDNTVMLGQNRLQIIQTTDQYGDMKIINTGEKVERELLRLPDDAKCIFVPPLNQVWLIGNDGFVLVYDLTFSSFYKRQFNSPVIDVISVNEKVFIVKSDRISILTTYYMRDDDEALKWSFKAKRLITHNELLMKRVQISITPHFDSYVIGDIVTGAIINSLPMPDYLTMVQGNHAPLYHNRTLIYKTKSKGYVVAVGDVVYKDSTPIYHNTQPIWTMRNIMSDKRCVYRNKRIDIKGNGIGGAFVLNSIAIDVVEV